VTDKPVGSKITWGFSDKYLFFSVFIGIYFSGILFY